jgi:hypothetical protein
MQRKRFNLQYLSLYVPAKLLVMDSFAVPNALQHAQAPLIFQILRNLPPVPSAFPLLGPLSYDTIPDKHLGSSIILDHGPR